MPTFASNLIGKAESGNMWPLRGAISLTRPPSMALIDENPHRGINRSTREMIESRALVGTEAARTNR
jgi:hypothetical protein